VLQLSKTLLYSCLQLLWYIRQFDFRTTLSEDCSRKLPYNGNLISSKAYYNQRTQYS